MIKKVYILTILLVGLIAIPVLSQGSGSAQASMRVSVTVVSGSSVDVERPDIVMLSAKDNSDLGTINFRGINEGDVIISNANNLTLTDSEGNHEVTINVESQRSTEGGSNRIQFRGKSKDAFLSSVYQGELTTSIEYF